jgi:hypothetical protein
MWHLPWHIRRGKRRSSRISPLVRYTRPRTRERLKGKHGIFRAR